jgi:hypothetical protein
MALEKKDLQLKDFNKTDNYVINKLKSANRDKYNEVLSLLQRKDLSSLKKTTKPSHKKFRYVDPEVLIKEKIKPLSEIDENFKRDLVKAQKHNIKGIFPGKIR